MTRIFQAFRPDPCAATRGAAVASKAATLGAVALVGTAMGGGATAADPAEGLVASITKAPVVPDGDVAGAQTDLVINLDIDPDPAVPGLALAAGETIRVTLPDGFVFADPEGYPLMDFLGGPNCSPVLLHCSTAILLQGWPQQPILPSFPPGETAQYEIAYDAAANAVTIAARTAFDGIPLPGPGLKQIHLALLGFRNPEAPGAYPIDVAVLGADGSERLAGTGMLTLRPVIAPSLNVASVFDDNGGDPPNPNTMYQETRPGTPAPMPWDFLVWDESGKAFDGLAIVQDSPAGGRLVQGDTTVGTMTIKAPAGAEGHRIEGGPAVALDKEPVFGAPIPTGRLTAQFVAGSAAGRYEVTLALDGGNAVTMVVDAVEE